MKNKRIFQASSVIAASIALIVLAMGTFNREPTLDGSTLVDDAAFEKQIEASAQSITQLTQALTLIGDKLARLEQAQERLSQQRDLPPAATGSDRSLMMPTDEQESPPTVESEPELKDDEYQFASESFDADWSLAMEESALTALIDYEMVDTELDVVECYQSACRFEFQQLSSSDNDELLIELLQANEAFAGEFSASTVIDENGATRTVIVVGKADDVVIDESPL